MSADELITNKSALEYIQSGSNFVGMAELSQQEFRKLKGIYTSLTNTAALVSAENLRKASGLSRKKVQEFLGYSKTFSKFKHVTRKFKRFKVRSPGINHIWSMDVAFREKLANQNSGYR